MLNSIYDNDKNFIYYALINNRHNINQIINILWEYILMTIKTIFTNIFITIHKNTPFSFIFLYSCKCFLCYINIMILNQIKKI